MRSDEMFLLIRQPGAETEGPFSIDTLRAMVKRSEVMPDSMLCEVGTKHWFAAIARLYEVPDTGYENVHDYLINGRKAKRY